MSGSLLDTNVIIRFFKKEVPVVNFISGMNGIYISSVVLGELIYGAEKSARKSENTRRALEFFSMFQILVPDKNVAIEYGRIKADLVSRGRILPENDMWIAATALANGLNVVTQDRHFAEIPGLNVINL